MSDTYPFALFIALLATVGLTSLLSNRLTERIRVPAPLLVLWRAAGAVALSQSCMRRQSDRGPSRDGGVGLHPVRRRTAHRLGAASLGCRPDRHRRGRGHLPYRRPRPRCSSTSRLDWAGTWRYWSRPRSPRPILRSCSRCCGQREIAGRSDTILEGESGANDPVGIALMLEPDHGGRFQPARVRRCRAAIRVADGRRAGYRVLGARAAVVHAHRPLPARLCTHFAPLPGGCAVRGRDAGAWFRISGGLRRWNPAR